MASEGRAHPLALLLAAVSLLAALSASAQGAGVDGTLRVGPDVVVGEVDPSVYGVNYGAYGAVPYDLYPLAETAGFRFLRYPGGHWGDLNDIQRYQIDTIVAFARFIGAEPSVQARLLHGTPEAAAELVRYANVERGYAIRHWSVGNEPSLYRDYSVDDLNAAWRAVAQAMRAVDPDIVLIGPEPHQWTGLPGRDPTDAEGREWVRGFLEANGDLIDVVAVHRYPFPRSSADPGTTIDDLRRDTLEWTGLISRLRALSEEVTGRDDLRYGVTEVNSHWSPTIGGEATNDSFFNAIWWADVLGKLIVDGASIVNYFDLHSSDGRGGFGLFSNQGVRPTFHVYTLYARFGSLLVEASSDVPFVGVYAALRDDGALTLLVTNLADEPRRLALDLTAGPSGPRALVEARLLDPDHAAVRVDDPRDEDGVLRLGARSALLLVFGEGVTPP
jgi:hypothetical protein